MPVADTIALACAGLLAVAARHSLNGAFAPSEYLAFVPTLALFLLVFSMYGLYPGIAANSIQEFRRVLCAISLGYLLVIGATFLIKDSNSYSRLAFRPRLVPKHRVRTRWPRLNALLVRAPALVGGTCCNSRQRSHSACHAHVPRIEPVRRPPAHRRSWIADRIRRSHAAPDSPESRRAEHCLISGDLAIAPGLAHRYRNYLRDRRNAGPFQSGSRGTHRRLCKRFPPRPRDTQPLQFFSSLWVSAKELGGMLGLEVSQTLAHRLPLFVKRCFDLLLAGVLTLVLSPVLIALYLCVRVSSPGPAFYGQRRVGRDDRSFTAWKFRTMVPGADQVLQKHLEADPELLEEWLLNHKLRRDPRVTTVGRFLRKTSLDELPQIWNVLRGEMSVVGPRPIVPAEVSKYGKRFDLYRKVAPGITGLWQVSGRNNTTYEARTEFDEYYVRNWSVCLDLYILFRTVKTVLFAEGAY